MIPIIGKMVVNDLLAEADEQLAATQRLWPWYGVPVPPANELYLKALEQMGRNPPREMESRARLGLGRYYAHFGKSSLGTKDDYRKAFPELQRAYHLSPDDKETQFYYAQMCYILVREPEAPFRRDSLEYKLLFEGFAPVESQAQHLKSPRCTTPTHPSFTPASVAEKVMKWVQEMGRKEIQWML